MCTLEFGTLPALFNMERFCGRSNSEKESLKEITLTPTATLISKQIILVRTHERITTSLELGSLYG